MVPATQEKFLTKLQYHVKIFTGGIASLISIMTVVTGLLLLINGNMFGLFLLVLGGLAYWFQSDLLETLREEERKKNILKNRDLL